MDALLRRRIMMMAGSSPTPPGPPTPTQETITMSSADLFAGKSCGGFLNTTSPYVFKTSGTWYGVLIDVGSFAGKAITFERASTSTLIRYAYLTSSTLVNNVAPSYSTEIGYTGIINNSTDTTIAETIPSDAQYLYVYTRSNGTNVAPTITIEGTYSSQQVSLNPSMFTPNMTIATTGKVVTGSSSAPAQCCTDYLPVHDYGYLQQVEFVINGLPSGVGRYMICVVEYTSGLNGQIFIRRDTYTAAPFTQTLAPECTHVRVIVVCQDSNNTDIPTTEVLFDDNMIQTVKSINTE